MFGWGEKLSHAGLNPTEIIKHRMGNWTNRKVGSSKGRAKFQVHEHQGGGGRRTLQFSHFNVWSPWHCKWKWSRDIPLLTVITTGAGGGLSMTPPEPRKMELQEHLWKYQKNRKSNNIIQETRVSLLRWQCLHIHCSNTPEAQIVIFKTYTPL